MRVSRKVRGHHRADIGGDDERTGLKIEDPVFAEIVGPRARGAWRLGEPAPAGHESTLQDLNARALHGIADLVQDTARNRARSRQRDVDVIDPAPFVDPQRLASSERLPLSVLERQVAGFRRRDRVGARRHA